MFKKPNMDLLSLERGGVKLERDLGLADFAHHERDLNIGASP